MTAANGTGGSSMAKSRGRAWPTSTTAQGRPLPTRNCATRATGRCVADRPIRRKGRPAKACRRSRVSARCAPRLLPAKAWISSTITVCTLRRPSRPDAEPISTYRDSGVVTRMCGASLRMAARSFCGVSPVRTAVVMRGAARPCSARAWLIPSSGACRLTRMSLDSALSGET